MACVVDGGSPRAKETVLVNELLRKIEKKKEEEIRGCVNTPQG